MGRIVLYLWLVSTPLMTGQVAAQESHEWVTEHPFQRRDALKLRSDNSGFGNRVADSNTDDQPMSFTARSAAMLKTWQSNPRIRSTQKSFKSFSLYKNDKLQMVHYGFEIDGYPFCDYELKVHESLSGQMSAIGHVPQVEVNREFSDGDWITEADLSQAIQEVLLLKGYNQEYQIDQRRKCLWNAKGEVEPVYEVVVESSGTRFAIVLDATQVYRFEPQIFHATAQMSIFPNNEADKERQVFQINNMKDDGTLENTAFIGCLPSGSPSSNCPIYEGNTKIPYEVVRESGNVHNYNPDSEYSKFAQTSVFTNANRALAWLLEHGYDNFGQAPLRLAVHAAFERDINNALYEPRPSFAMIYVGDGDNNILQNLATDADVVSHELGHHVVYNSIKRIEGESLVLHEGIADYLTYARTGNACLGETICPDTSLGARICAVPKQCLRTADNNYTLTSPDLPREAHQKSQFISGMLWDLTVKDGIPAETVAKIVLKGLELLVSNSGYRHFAISLLLADNANYSGNFCEKIRNRALLRGLGSYLGDITCERVKSDSLGSGNVETYLGISKESPTTTKESRRGKTNCGVIGGPNSSGQKSMQLIILALPLLIVSLRRWLK